MLDVLDRVQFGQEEKGVSRSEKELGVMMEEVGGGFLKFFKLFFLFLLFLVLSGSVFTQKYHGGSVLTRLSSK